MTKSQKLALELSKNRQRLAALLAKDELSDDERSELDSLTTRQQQAEIEYRAAIVAEDDIETREVPAEDAETREFMDLERRSTVAEFVCAAIEGREVRGASLEFSQAVNAGGRLPLRLLAPELETRETTDTESTVSQQTWLDRLFFDTAAARVGVSMRSVGAGVASYPVTTAGASAAQRGRSEAAADAAWTVGTTEIKPSRNAVRAVFNIEDAARLPGLEDALKRDLSAALKEGIDRAVFISDGGANENAADITGLQTASIDEVTITQANKVKADKTLEAFAGMIDGKHAASLGDLGVVASIPANTLWLTTIANAAAENQTLAQFLRASGLDWSARGALSDGTSNGKFGAYVGRRRGIDGAGVAAVWEAADLIRDPYSGASKGEVALTLSYLWGFKLPRAAAFQRVKFVT